MDRRLEQSFLINLCCGIEVKLAVAKVINLVFLETSDQGTLVLLEYQFGNELAHALHVEQLDYVYLIG